MILHLYPTQSDGIVSVVFQKSDESETAAILRSVRHGAIIQRSLDSLTPIISDSSARSMYADIIVHT